MHAQKQLLRNFRSKIWPRHSLRRPRFPIRLIHFHYRVMFTGYIRCFCATTLHDLVTLRVFHVQCFSCLTHIPIIIILRLSVTELRVLNIWYNVLTVTGSRNKAFHLPLICWELCDFCGKKCCRICQRVWKKKRFIWSRSTFHWSQFICLLCIWETFSYCKVFENTYEYSWQ